MIYLRFFIVVWFEYILLLLCLIIKIVWYSLLIYNLFEECIVVFVGVYWMVVGLFVLGKIGVFMVFVIIYLFFVEFFFIVVRNLVMGVSFFSVRIGGMILFYIVIIVSYLILGLIEMNYVVCVY